MRRVFQLMLVPAVVGLLCTPIPARADGYIAPWAGVNFGADAHEATSGFGATAGYMGDGRIGGEVNFGYSPGFFNVGIDEFENIDRNTIHNSNLDLMGNLIVGFPYGGTTGAGFRPFATVGLGMIRTSFSNNGPLSDDDLLLLNRDLIDLDLGHSNNNFAWSYGLGAMGTFNEHVGLRADVRHYKTINGEVFDKFSRTFQDLAYWRTEFGLVIR